MPDQVEAREGGFASWTAKAFHRHPYGCRHPLKSGWARKTTPIIQRWAVRMPNCAAPIVLCFQSDYTPVPPEVQQLL